MASRPGGRRGGITGGPYGSSRMLFDLVSVLWRLAAVSAAIAVILHLMGTSAHEVLAKIGATPEEIGDLIARGWELALPNLMLGIVVIVPLWLIVFMMRPPRG